MHPPDCPGFDYSQHPNRPNVLPERAETVLRRLAREHPFTFEVAVDSREVHGFVFQELTQPGYEYFAGHYRGEAHRCLRYYEVAVGGDPRVGAPSRGVLYQMNQLAAEVTACLRALDENVLLRDEQRLRYTLLLACRVFVAFLTIHPYADGNGHAARFILWSVLGRYGHWPQNFPVEPRPPNPAYPQLISQYRDGDRTPLEAYVLSTLT